MAEYKGTEIDTRPTEAMAEEAQRGLDWRAEFGRGGTEVGVARARDLANRRELSLDTVRRMASFFARHAVDKQAEGFRPGEEGYPSAGRIAHALWGGDPGESWANARVERMNRIDEAERSFLISDILSLPGASPATKSNLSVFSGLLNDVVSRNFVSFCAEAQKFGDHVGVRSASKVFSASDWLKMCGIDARSVSAQMVEMQSVLNRPVLQFVTESMCRNKFFLSTASAQNEIAIATRSLGSDPLPALGVIAVFDYLFPKANCWRYWFHSHNPNDSTSKSKEQDMDAIDNRAAPDALRVGDFVSWDNPGGRARGRIERIERDGTINVPESSFEITGTPDDPAALIRLYREGEDGWDATGTLVAHKFSTLTKINDLRSLEVRPYPNEHAARLTDPDQYDEFRRETDAGGPGIDFIYGIKGGESELQAVRFDKTRYTVEEAREWLDENDLSPLLFEPAMEETDMDGRHIVGVTETENSFVVEFAKAHDETIMPEDESPAEIVEEIIEGTDELIENDIYEGSFFPAERKGEPLITRADEMEPIVESERRVRMAISSEMPVERIGGMEILEHSAGAIDLSFLNSGRAPLLLDHDPTQQIGVIESVSLDESARKLRATVRFGKSGRASEVYDDVVDGIRGNVSIGYYVKKVTRESDGKVYRATAWQPLEVSVVSIPADSSVGVGRSAEISQPVIEVISNPKGTEMSQENTGAVTAEAAIAKRNAELKQISELAARHNKSNLVATAIERGMSYGEFQGYLLERNLDKPLHAPDVEMTKTEQKRYSLLRAIDSMAKHGRVTGFEAEVSEEIARNTGKAARGFFVPMSMFAKRDILTTSPANGSNIIAEDYMAGEFIDALRANLVIGSLGARMMTGLKGDVAIPKMGTTSTVAFVGENSAPSESAQTFSQVTMSPKTLASFTDISRKLAIQSDPSVEQIIREDILQSFARKIDEVAIEGGGSNEPTGILGTNGIGSAAMGSNGGAITYAKLVELEREVAIDNALMGNLAFLTNPKVVAAMRTRPRQTSGVEGNFILNDTNVLLGYNVASTTLVPSDLTKGTASNVCSAVIFGNFSDLMIGMWNSPDVLVDPYTGSSAGTIRIAAFQEVDVKVRHAESFAAIKDVTTA